MGEKERGDVFIHIMRFGGKIDIRHILVKPVRLRQGRSRKDRHARAGKRRIAHEFIRVAPGVGQEADKDGVFDIKVISEPAGNIDLRDVRKRLLDFIQKRHYGAVDGAFRTLEILDVFIPDDDILARLLDLNLARAEAESDRA